MDLLYCRPSFAKQAIEIKEARIVARYRVKVAMDDDSLQPVSRAAQVVESP